MQQQNVSRNTVITYLRKKNETNDFDYLGYVVITGEVITFSDLLLFITFYYNLLLFYLLL